MSKQGTFKTNLRSRSYKWIEAVKWTEVNCKDTFKNTGTLSNIAECSHFHNNKRFMSHTIHSLWTSLFLLQKTVEKEERFPESESESGSSWTCRPNWRFVVLRPSLSQLHECSLITIWVILQTNSKQTSKMRQQHNLSGGRYDTDLEFVWLRCVCDNHVVTFSQLHLSNNLVHAVSFNKLKCGEWLQWTLRDNLNSC